MFEIIPVERESSTIAGTAYDSVNQVMRIQFKTGRSYDYQNVPPEKHQKVRDEGGSYFDAEIKKKAALHPYSKVS